MTRKPKTPTARGRRAAHKAWATRRRIAAVAQMRKEVEACLNKHVDLLLRAVRPTKVRIACSKCGRLNSRPEGQSGDCRIPSACVTRQQLTIFEGEIIDDGEDPNPLAEDYPGQRIGGA